MFWIESGPRPEGVAVSVTRTNLARAGGNAAVVSMLMGPRATGVHLLPSIETWIW